MKKLLLLSFLFVSTALSAVLVACLSDEASPWRGAAAASRPATIAVIPFPLASGTPTPAVDVADIIRGDLGSTGRFETIPLSRLPSRPTNLADVDFEQWRRTEADFLVVGLVAIVHDGGHEVEFRLVDTLDERSVVGFVIPSAPDQLVGTAQKIARIIDDRLRPSSRLVAVD